LKIIDLFVPGLGPPTDTHTHAVIRKKGPDSLTNASVELTCSAIMTTTSLLQGEIKIPPFSITVSLNPGERKAFDTKIWVDTRCAMYDVKCEVQVYCDTEPDDDTYEETIPMWGGYGCLY
jgi:hypothetical protein